MAADVIQMPQLVTRAIRAVFGGANGEMKGPTLPDGMEVKDFIKASDALKPCTDYRRRIEIALDYYRNEGQADTLKALKQEFPLTADRMTPVELPVLRYIINRQATVFSGKPKFEILDASRTPIEERGGVRWADVVAAAQLGRHLKQLNRLTRLCKRAFVRVTWDWYRGRTVLTTFSPDKVHVLFKRDSRNLNEALGILFELEPGIDEQGKKVERWEYWSAGENPQNFIIDERGKVSGWQDANGVEHFENPYKDGNKKAIVPIVSFGDEDESVGFWLPPQEGLVNGQRAINVYETNFWHVLLLQAYGQWISESQPGADRTGEWTGAPLAAQKAGGLTRAEQIRQGKGASSGEMTIAFSPDTIVPVPEGLTLKNIAPAAALAETLASNKEFKKQFLTLQGVPPGQLLGESRAMSGYALDVENEPLAELREEQLALYQQPTEDLIEVVRIVFDAHQGSNATRFGASFPRFTPGEFSGPEDPVERRNDQQFRLTQRLASRAEIVVEQRGVTLEQAEQIVADIDGEPDPRKMLCSADVTRNILGRDPTPPAGPVAAPAG